MAKAQLLRQQMFGRRPARAVGAHNGLTAKLVEQAGFEAIWASSFELSASFGLPDASLLTMTEYLDAAEAMDEVVSIPVIADCDTGFGGPLNVARAVKRFERRGIAAICIEDKLFPKMNSFAVHDHQLIAPDEFARKIAAGKAAQRDADFMVIARTETLVAGGSVDAALERAHVYADAGADAILVHSKSSLPDEVLAFAARWDRDVPLVAVPTTYPEIEEPALYGAGVRLVIYANHGLRAAVRAVQEALAELSRAGHASGLNGQIATIPEVFALQGMPPALTPVR